MKNKKCKNHRYNDKNSALELMDRYSADENRRWVYCNICNKSMLMRIRDIHKELLD